MSDKRLDDGPEPERAPPADPKVKAMADVLFAALNAGQHGEAYKLHPSDPFVQVNGAFDLEAVARAILADLAKG